MGQILDQKSLVDQKIDKKKLGGAKNKQATLVFL
jgi:hypothetical protein